MTKDQGLFSTNERVLCFHGPLIYEAKILKVEEKKKDKEWTYLVHYAGWNKSWDSLVPESRLLKYNEDNLKRQKEHEAAVKSSNVKTNKKLSSGGPKSASGKRVGSVAGDSTTSSGNASATESRPSTPVDEKPEKEKKSTKASSVSSTTTDSKRRKLEDTIELVDPPKEEKNLNKQDISISIPEKVRIFLVDDWNFVNRQKKLFTIPARKAVDNILQEFVDSRGDDDAAREFSKGVKTYFNIMLGVQLLYRFERIQYGDFLRNERELRGETEEEFQANPPPMSAIYGAPHLMRLFVRLGACLAMTTLGPEAVMNLQLYVGHFMDYILENFDEYLSRQDYGMSSPEYQRKSPV